MLGTCERICFYRQGVISTTPRMQKTQQLVNNPVSEEALELINFYDGEHEPDAKILAQLQISVAYFCSIGLYFLV